MLLFAFASSYAQSYDVGVTAIILPDTNQPVAYDYNDFVEIEFTNFGSPLDAGDTVVMTASIEINGSAVDFFTLTIPISFTVPSGVSIPVQSPSPLDLSQVLGSFQGEQKEICVRADLTTQTDINPGNDEYCYTYTITSAPVTGSYDVAISAIVNPDTTAMLAYDYNDTLQILFENIGDALNSGDTVIITIDIEETNGTTITSIPLIFPVQGTIPTGISLIAGAPIDLSSFLANYEGQQVTICGTAELITQTDNNLNNNTYCFTYTVSTSMTTGIDDSMDEKVEISFYNNSLNITNNSVGNTVSVYNVNGQMVFQNSNGNSYYDLSLNQGIYIVTVANKSQILNTNKVLVN